MQKLLTWNIRHGGGKRVDRIIECLIRHQPDAVVLTGFRNNEQGLRLRRALESAGLGHQAPGRAPPPRNTVLIAVRDPFDPSVPTSALIRYEHCCVQASFGALELFGFYFPQGDAKGPLFEWVLNPERGLLRRQAILSGDFNASRSCMNATWRRKLGRRLRRAATICSKTVRRERMAENLAIFDFELDTEDMAAIAALDAGTGCSGRSIARLAAEPEC